MITALEFVQWYSNLAPEGETMLIIRPIGKGFPAFLPKKWKPGESWYGNTGSYVLERLGKGRQISASVRNIDRVAFFLFDDINTKSKAPPLEPTWIMETSPGNYQWVCVFRIDDQPTPPEYNAAYRAVADAGYSDKGAGNPVRNFRLPGSVNLKPGRDKFESRLVEFHPDREFSLAEICAACGVTPGETSAILTSMTVADDGKDEVLAWLSDNGHVLSSKNVEGWYGVACPNAGAHSDGNMESRYSPSNRAWTCFHSSCQHLDSESFLAWVEDHGGPSCEHGLRTELLADDLSAALAKLTPTLAFPDAAARVEQQTEIKERARLEKELLHDRWAYIESDDAYFDLEERTLLKRVSFDAVYRHLPCKRGEKTRIEASKWFDEHRVERNGKSLGGITYAAGDSVLCHMDGRVYGNKWRDLRLPPGSGDVTPWLAHCKRMLPDPDELRHVLDVLAFKLQHPRIKINHAILHASLPGAGKDTMYAPFFEAIGRGNVSTVSSDTLHSQFNYDLEAEVMVINELRQTDGADRRALENRLKPVIAAPPEFLSVNRKGLHPYNLVNRGLVMAFSNYRDAIALPSNDRRWFVGWSSADQMDRRAAAKLWAWYNAGGYAAVAGWLMSRDVSAFMPGATPPQTEAKALLCEQSLNAAESWLLEMIGTAAEFKTGVIGGPFNQLLDTLQNRATTKLYAGALFHALAEAGWVDCGRIRYTGGPLRRVFCRPDRKHLSTSELSHLCDVPAPATIMSLVKNKPA